MSKESFQALIGEITGSIAGKALDDALAGELNARYPAGGETFKAGLDACHEAIAEAMAEGIQEHSMPGLTYHINMIY